ncbi:FecR domain-containing protein [Flavivirga amylovorans]|uniref:FecR domain-containing protein n=1 Tax=Flavivirga amylovorans TaxID=870486 RepID=A0ABT8X1Q5_9FLAO|nr:FecR family protein [Flavivirga amylovorans]MDO5987534.1 FecR domain-containing protein [Flavivirga amylovorans]
MKKDIKNICVKYLMNEANAQELENLEAWLKKGKNKETFATYIKINYAMDVNMNPFDKETAKKEYLERIWKDKRSHKKLRRIKTFSYAAASIVVLIAASFWFTKMGNTIIEPQFTEPIIVNNQIQTGTDKATLTLENGEQIALTKGASFQTQNATSNGEEIVYITANSQQPIVKDSVSHNTLTIPRGGQFQLTLTDGTQVWLNSESQLKYPVVFNKGETRQVELVYGEAYFDVSPSNNHKGADFKVYHKQQEVQVLGTEFNIKAYKDETNVYTTLVEGKVSVTTGSKTKILLPAQQSNLDIVVNSLGIANVEVYDIVSWKEGIFSFERKPLKEIMTTLSRWYDMDVIFANKDLETIRFMGSLNKGQNIVDVLNDIKNFGVINTYEINNKTITLK